MGTDMLPPQLPTEIFESESNDLFGVSLQVCRRESFQPFEPKRSSRPAERLDWREFQRSLPDESVEKNDLNKNLSKNELA